MKVFSHVFSSWVFFRTSFLSIDYLDNMVPHFLMNFPHFPTHFQTISMFHKYVQAVVDILLTITSTLKHFLYKTI